jgi:hypothetical protein
MSSARVARCQAQKIVTPSQRRPNILSFDPAALYVRTSARSRRCPLPCDVPCRRFSVCLILSQAPCRPLPSPVDIGSRQPIRIQETTSLSSDLTGGRSMILPCRCSPRFALYYTSFPSHSSQIVPRQDKHNEKDFF